MTTADRPRAGRGAALSLAIALAFSSVGVISGQGRTRPTTETAPPGSAAAAISAEPAGETYTFTYFNRPILVLRARILGRSPSERAASAEHALDELVAERITGPIESRPFEGATLITVGSRGVLVLASPDVDALSGETIETSAAEVVRNLQQALREAEEARSPRLLLREAAVAGVGLLFGLLVLWGILRARRVVTRKVLEIAARKLTGSGLADVNDPRASRILDFQRGIITLVSVVLDIIVTYSTLTFALRQFPYTRPWGESLRGFLVATVEQLSLGIVGALPGLFTAALIFVLTRFFVRLIRLWFDAVERGRIEVSWLFPETAQTTRRLITTLLWLFAIVVAYPYLPGSQTEAFKGVSVFLGLMVTFGSSGLVNQLMSGFMIIYSRALRVGDFVRIGDMEGTVLRLGMLSVKVRTLRHEDVTVPNAVVVAQTTTDYSRAADTGGVLTPTSVTIGYDTPWRQVHAMLLLAAERTPGLRKTPKPIVIQAGLEDFYVKYSLFVSLENQESRFVVFDTLHANIQDLFNEYGVQIMSPNYMLDPAAPKVVPRQNWFAAPAAPNPPQKRD